MTLRARLAVLFAVVAVGGVVCASVAAYVTFSNELHHEVDRFLAQRSEEIVQGSRQAPRNGGPNPGPPIAVDADAIVQVLDDSGDPASSTGSRLPVGGIEAGIARSGGNPYTRVVTVDGVKYQMITKAMRREGAGAVQVARSLGEVDDILSKLRNQLVLLGVVVAVLAAAVGWLFARRATAPLRRLADTASHIAESGDLTTSVPVERHDEVGQVAESFDEMLGALATSRDQQRRLVEDASHELRTPLTALRTDVGLLRRAPDYDPVKRDELLASVDAEVVELADLVTELVELATESHNDEAPGPVDLADVVDAAVERARRRTDREITVDAKPSPVIGQAALLERAVANLLGNALKFSPPDTPIDVLVDGGAVAVRDHGPGIAVDERERVFDRFYRSPAARSAPGSGLGLAIVAKVVSRHGGTVWVADAPGGGAEVGFRIPPAS